MTECLVLGVCGQRGRGKAEVQGGVHGGWDARPLRD